eukprot:5386956-Prorocentrum_lima.AAC.1
MCQLYLDCAQSKHYMASLTPGRPNGKCTFVQIRMTSRSTFAQVPEAYMYYSLFKRHQFTCFYHAP